MTENRDFKKPIYIDVLNVEKRYTLRWICCEGHQNFSYVTSKQLGVGICKTCGYIHNLDFERGE